MVEEEEEKGKPRRLDEKDAAYLTQLDVRLNEDKVSFEDAFDRDVMVANVLSEVKLSTASAACDRRTNGIIEKLCYMSSLTHLLEFMVRFIPYGVFLARNRHSSHVLQAMIVRLCNILKSEGLGETDEDYLKTTVLQFVEPILKEISWLSKELCATHVLRSIFCILGGLPVISERKVRV